MQTGITHAPGLDSAAALSAILSLAVAEHEERDGGDSRRTERILVRSGLSADQITAITAGPAREPSVIDRAREVLTRQSSTGEHRER